MKIHKLVVLFAFAAVLFALVRPVAAQELQPAAEAGVNTEVVAQGISTFTGGEIAWRLVEDTAEPIGGAGFEERALGFAVAADGAILLTDDPSGARTLLDEGEATFTGEGAVQLRESLDDATTPYYRIGLVEASEAGNGNGDEVLFAGNGFDAPEGDYEVELTGVKLAADESASVASEFEALVVVTEGEVTVGDGEVIGAGEATAVSGEVELRTEDEAARVFVAVIGSAVPAAPVAPVEESTPVAEEETEETGTGKIVVTNAICPAGVTAEQAAEDPCFGGAPVEGMLVTATDEQGESYEVEMTAGGTVALEGLPAGEYELTFSVPEGFGETVGVCGGQDSSADLDVVSFAASSVVLDLPADREYDCITSTLEFAAEVTTDGVLTATFYACPDGMTFETLDPAQCEVITEGFDFGFQGSAFTTPELHLGDAGFDGTTFAWSGLVVATDGETGISYSPILYAYPDGYDALAISTDGGEILLPHAGGYLLTQDQPSFSLAVYFFSS